jgi:hypothetical protein
MGNGLWVMGYGLWVMGYGLWVMGNGEWVQNNWAILCGTGRYAVALTDLCRARLSRYLRSNFNKLLAHRKFPNYSAYCFAR